MAHADEVPAVFARRHKVWYNMPSRTIGEMMSQYEHRSHKADTGRGPGRHPSCSIACEGLMHRVHEALFDLSGRMCKVLHTTCRARPTIAEERL